MKTLIVDDEPLARNELNYLLTQNGHFTQIDEAETISETLEKLLYETYDVIFLDINLMNESGLDLAEKINKMKQPPMIIFATAHDTFAVKAFELAATDYILKPFEQARINQAVERVIQKQTERHVSELKGDNTTPEQKIETNIQQEPESQRQPSVLPIELNDRIYVLNQHDIIAITTNAGKTTLYTIDQTYETNETLNNYTKRLDTDAFIKIHRATVINQAHIKTIEHWFNYTYQVTLTNNLKFQVSRSYMKPFKEAIGLN